MSWNQGEKGILSATFTRDGQAAEPETPVQVRVWRPDGDELDASPFRATGTGGVYEYEFAPDVAGVWRYRFESADGGIEGDSFYVDPH